MYACMSTCNMSLTLDGGCQMLLGRYDGLYMQCMYVMCMYVCMYVYLEHEFDVGWGLPNAAGQVCWLVYAVYVCNVYVCMHVCLLGT